MELSLAERKVLAAIELNARRPVAEVSRALRLHQHTVRRAIERMRARGIIRPAIFLSLNALGFGEYNIHFSLSPERKQAEERLLQRCVEHERVTYLCEVGGAWQYSMSVWARNYIEVHGFLRALADEFGPIFFNKEIGGVLSLTDFGVKTLYPERQKVSPLRCSFDDPSAKIDELDHHILQAIVAQPEMPMSDLARKVGCPLTTVIYRVTQLEKSQILKGFRYVVFSDPLNLSSFRFLIRSRGFDRTTARAFSDFCAGHRAVAFLMEMFGPWDYELGVRVPSPEHAMSLSREIHRRFGAWLNSVELITVFNLLKFSRYPFSTLPTATSASKGSR